MRSFVKFIVPFIFAIPAIALAQTSEPFSRAQAHEHMVRLEKAGYSPLVNDPLYPHRLQQAEAALSKQEADNAAYGPQAEGTVVSGK
ncbi:DUF4148 domain-containing protein [Caballeronia sp. LZ065]|uniref:DUF4148 domain-containing protein n=1 Tax=Caballeronia sp. LZ065 TaxID=3038571 RepID=UPI002855AE85|nr:DUF4148 domain-containing protein [Caballeronia sp. LZ065]MDR5781117.1 DUF4148 domain-containing protein [Caballeronia sp. LZ065]